MNLLTWAFRRLAGIGVVVLLAVGVSGCATPSAPQAGTERGGGAPHSWEAFPENTRFDYQLGGAYVPPSGTAVVVRDRGEKPEPGLYSVCYINAFQTQPGEQARWPAALLLRDAKGVVADPDWPDEVLLDTSTPEKRERIVDRVGEWIRGCASEGFQAVEFDNLDSFVRSGGRLSFANNLLAAKELASTAHQAGLAAGQKNAAEHTSELSEVAGFDFAVSEECAAFDECGSYTSVYGGAVIDIEYADALPRSFEVMCSDPESPASMILRDRKLLTSGDPSHLYRRC